MNPIPGDIWSDRYSERRVKVVHVWTFKVQIKSVLHIGTEWQFKRGACSRSFDTVRFMRRFRLLRRHS